MIGLCDERVISFCVDLEDGRGFAVECMHSEKATQGENERTQQHCRRYLGEVDEATIAWTRDQGTRWWCMNESPRENIETVVAAM